MRTRSFISVVILTFFLSGCVVFSFYPLYTEKDLFPNDLLTGAWIDTDESETDSEWHFEHPYYGKKVEGNMDSCSYILTLRTEEDKIIKESVFQVHVIKLGDHYFLDFYLNEYFEGDNLDLASFHLVPVHTFAKLTIEQGQIRINWFDHDWLSDLIEENKIRIHHEMNDEFVLLTAKPAELQKFVSKYASSEEAYKDGIEAVLKRK